MKPYEDFQRLPRHFDFFGHYEVPIVGMPVFIDQGDILTRMEEAGIAVGVSKEASSEEIHQAIREVRDNKEYKRNIVKLSEVLRDKKYENLNIFPIIFYYF